MGRIFYYLCIFIYLGLDAVSFSQNVILHGNAPSYANSEIIFYRYTDFITKTEEEAGKCLVNDRGDFRILLNLDSITFVFSHLGIYKAFLYAEPNKTYEIILPEKTDKAPEDELNPYFIESRIQLGIASMKEDDLNFIMRTFNDAYTPYYNKHIINFINKEDFSELNADIERMERPFVNSNNSFFNSYRNYRYGLLKHLAFQQKARNISDEYFRGKPVLYNNPAYMELFNQVYDKYFVFFGRTNKGEKIYNDINILKSYSELRNTLAQDDVFSNDTVIEMVILKGVHDEFYRDNFSRTGLLNVLDSLISNTNIKQHKVLGEIIKAKVTRLLSGYYPPGFELYDADSNLVRLTDFRGKYVYLNFCTAQSYTCLSEFELLSGIYERHKDRLEIVTISVDPIHSINKDFLKSRNWIWKFLFYGNQPRVINEYDIRAYPTYFLIGPDGKLIYSPCPAPSEDFESMLYKAMKARGDL
jgi:peroxiredoxin